MYKYIYIYIYYIYIHPYISYIHMYLDVYIYIYKRLDRSPFPRRARHVCRRDAFSLGHDTATQQAWPCVYINI